MNECPACKAPIEGHVRMKNGSWVDEPVANFAAGDLDADGYLCAEWDGGRVDIYYHEPASKRAESD